jgi:O-acetyl-ADP-ribose deacetylase (regulator of RNase III)
LGYKIINGKIEEQEVDAIVNASNGIGWMGGIIGKHVKLPGVAESLHYATNGEVEKEAKEFLKNNKCKRGDIFITSAANLKAKYIIHAVTMNFPGQKSDLATIEILLLKIIKKIKELDLKTIAIPLLGAGTGRIPEEKVISLYEKYFKYIDYVDVIIVTYDNNSK